MGHSQLSVGGKILEIGQGTLFFTFTIPGCLCLSQKRPFPPTASKTGIVSQPSYSHLYVYFIYSDALCEIVLNSKPYSIRDILPLGVT